MKPKTLIILFAVLTLLFMGLYFLTNPSYEKSIRAKYHYELGEYKEAYSLAKEAFSLDLYNRMAATIMAGSKTSLKYVKYNEDANKYMQIIDEIAAKENISEADKAKMKIISEIMTGSYIKLAPSVVTDSDLVKEAAQNNKKFEKLLEKLNRY